MYVKPSRRQGMYVPDNYHGTAFSSQEDEQKDEPATPEQAEKEHDSAQALIQSIQPEESPSKGFFPSLLSGFGGLRSDDVLLLALIVLLSRSEGEAKKGAAEILPLLAILLFLG